MRWMHCLVRWVDGGRNELPIGVVNRNAPSVDVGLRRSTCCPKPVPFDPLAADLRRVSEPFHDGIACDGGLGVRDGP